MNPDVPDGTMKDFTAGHISSEDGAPLIHALLPSLRSGVAALLKGVRGGKAADLSALADVVARVGDLAVALGDNLISLEINPLRVDGSQVEALDAVVEWTQP